MRFSRTTFLNLGSADISDWITFFCGYMTSLVHCRISNSIPGLCPFDNGSTHTLPVEKTKNDSRHCQTLLSVKITLLNLSLTMDVYGHTEIPWHNFRPTVSASLGEKSRNISVCKCPRRFWSSLSTDHLYVAWCFWTWWVLMTICWVHYHKEMIV